VNKVDRVESKKYLVNLQNQEIGEIVVAHVAEAHVDRLIKEFNVEHFVASSATVRTPKFLSLVSLVVPPFIRHAHVHALLTTVLRYEEAAAFLDEHALSTNEAQVELFSVVPRRRKHGLLKPNGGDFPQLRIATAASLARGPKLPVTWRIVVVGRGSETAEAVREGLHSSPWCRFLSTTVLGRGDRIKTIDGDKKIVTVADAAETTKQIPYDVLVLAEDLDEVTIQQLPQPTPLGVVAVTDKSLDQVITDKVRSLRWNPLARVVVYGGDLEGLQVVGKLLAEGVPGEKISLVVPEGTATADAGIQLSWEQTTRKKVEVLSGAEFTLKSVEQMNNKIRGVVFSSGRKVSCRLLVTCAKNDVSEGLYHALEDAKIVYDGRIVLSRNFQTSHANIYATGSVAMFSKTLRPEGPSPDSAFLRHEEYNKRECGLRLANELAMKAVNEAEHAFAENAGAPIFQVPLVKHGVVPGALTYVRVEMCGMQRKSDPSGKQIMTNTLPTGGRLFELDIRNNRVARVVYLGKDSIDTDALMSIVGLRVEFLNKIVERFHAGKIDDLMDFLTVEVWSKGLFHDRFPDFIGSLLDRANNGKTVEIQDIKKSLVAFLRKADLGDFFMIAN
jgi:hypothetical protein